MKVIILHICLASVRAKRVQCFYILHQLYLYNSATLRNHNHPGVFIRVKLSLKYLLALHCSHNKLRNSFTQGLRLTFVGSRKESCLHVAIFRLKGVTPGYSLWIIPRHPPGNNARPPLKAHTVLAGTDGGCYFLTFLVSLDLYAKF